MKTAGPRIADRVRAERRSLFVGREHELARLRAAVQGDGPIVTFVVGIGGMGKTSLLEMVGERLDEDGTAWHRLDCGAVEPTAAGLLAALGDSLGVSDPSVAAVAGALELAGPRVVLALDQYERFRLLDGWLRQELVPALPASARLILFARDAPVEAWTGAPGWEGLAQVLPLGPLADPDARVLLQRQRVPEGAAERLLQRAQGHPLALQLGVRAAAAASDDVAAPALDGATLRSMVDVLAPLFLRDVADPGVRDLLQAACLVRRATRSVLQAMLPDRPEQQAFEALRELPFVETTDEGLAVHETVRTAIAGSLRSLDPHRYQELRARAWRCLRGELQTASKTHLWRYTADTLYLVDRPELREAFFPREMPVFAIEVARPSDEPAIMAIVQRHDPADLPVVTAWWKALPRSFRVVRDGGARVAAFVTMSLAGEIPPALSTEDPLLARWFAHARDPAGGLPPDARFLVCRRLLVADTGERPSALRSACWLDAKRSYLEHPDVRRIYTATTHPGSMEVLAALGFELLEALTLLRPSGEPVHTTMLDFGPERVLGWLAGLVDAQFAGLDSRAPAPACALDAEARALSVDGRRMPLTRLEYGVMQYLLARPDQVLTRDELLRDVWGQSFGGSNVVDAVMKSLRKKLGAHAASIATVTGHGYRFTGFPPG
jgi:hypothetical protein